MHARGTYLINRKAVHLPSLTLPFTTTTAIHLSSSHRRPVFFKPPYFVFDMSQLSSSFQDLFNAALQEYENQTGCKLMEHPLAKQLETCDSVESITAILQEQAQIFRSFRGDDGKLMKSVKSSVDVIYTLSVSTVLGEGIGLVHSMSFIEVLAPNHPSTAIPTCESSICWHRRPTCRMSPSSISSPYLRDIEVPRRSKTLILATTRLLICLRPSRTSSADSAFIPGSLLRQF